MAKFITFIVFVVIVQGIGALIGMTFTVDDWYNVLNKPPFNPAPSLFGIVWPILYLLIAIAGWRVFTSEGETPGWGLWIGQLLLNWVWSPVFFGLHQIFWAMWIIVGALVLSLAFVSTVWDKDRVSAVCFIPYIAWLSFGLVLNFSIWVLN